MHQSTVGKEVVEWQRKFTWVIFLLFFAFGFYIYRKLLWTYTKLENVPCIVIRCGLKELDKPLSLLPQKATETYIYNVYFGYIDYIYGDLFTY